MGKANRIGKNILLALISAVFISPIVIVFFNSFKSKLFINNKPFMLPDRESFVGLGNYYRGCGKNSVFQGVCHLSDHYGMCGFPYYPTDIYDGLVYCACKKQVCKYTVFYVCFFHDGSFPDGNVYSGENIEYAEP